MSTEPASRNVYTAKVPDVQPFGDLGAQGQVNIVSNTDVSTPEEVESPRERQRWPVPNRTAQLHEMSSQPISRKGLETEVMKNCLRSRTGG